MSRSFSALFWLTAAALLAAACGSTALPAAPTPTPGITRLGRLTPFVSVSATPDPTATLAPTPTTQPSPTPTPRTHIVKAGEDLGGIAYMYRVTVPDLIAANPTINPRAMSIGLSLIIPPSKTNASAAENPQTLPNPGDVTPTPIPVESGPITCKRGQDGGVWCFMLLHNNQSKALEGISAQFSINSAGQAPLQANAYLPLDVLPAGAALPLTARFSPQQAARLAAPLQATGQILSALRSADDGRYLPARVEDAQVMIAPDGLSAAISLKVKLNSEDTGAGQVRVAAVAYDAQNNVVGVRRWDNTSASPLESGKTLEVRLSVYSVAEKIERVELFPEARP